MSFLRTWGNSLFYVGRDMFRPPGRYHAVLAWNDIAKITGREVPQWHARFADEIEITWEWPRARGFARLRRHKMPWRDFWNP